MHVSVQRVVDGGATDGGGARGTRGPQSVQSVPRAQLRNSEPGPPSSQSASEAHTHVSVQRGVDDGGSDDGGARGTRGPQSVQSVPYWQSGNSAPGPPSSQKPSEAYVGNPTHRSLQSAPLAGGGDATAGGGGERGTRGPQSVQSVPYWQSGYSAPGPPSSQKPSKAYVGFPTHRSLQSVGGEVCAETVTATIASNSPRAIDRRNERTSGLETVSQRWPAQQQLVCQGAESRPPSVRWGSTWGGAWVMRGTLSSPLESLCTHCTRRARRSRFPRSTAGAPPQHAAAPL